MTLIYGKLDFFFTIFTFFAENFFAQSVNGVDVTHAVAFSSTDKEEILVNFFANFI